jgi:hypothetical protein
MPSQRGSLLPVPVRAATRDPSSVIQRLLTAAALLAPAGQAPAGVAVPAKAIAVEPVSPCFVALDTDFSMRRLNAVPRGR